MMNNLKVLLITEKPSVARDFAKALSVPTNGNGFFENSNIIITWAIGHLMELKSPDEYDVRWKKWSFDNLPILPERLLYKPNIKTKKQLSIVLKCLKRKDLSKIIVATDAGREGELIGRTLIDQVKMPKSILFRFWTSQALSKEVIKDNLANLKPLSDYDRLYYAARARQSADWLVGMNLSRMATLKMKDTFSVGRVQTAVLALIVRRKKEIENFNSKKYFIINGEFSFKSSTIKTHWFNKNTKLPQFDTRIETREEVDKILKKCKSNIVSVESVKNQKKELQPPQLFSLTELQKTANRRFNFSAQKTLSLAQALYERHKCLSYPRTDARVLGTKSFEQIDRLVSIFKKSNPDLFKYYNLNKLQVSNKHIFNDAKLTDHHALIPLKNIDGKKLSSDEFKIFNLILKQFISVFLENYKYNETKIIFNINDESFKGSGHKVTCLGWKSLFSNEKDLLLPELSKGDVGKVLSIQEIEKKTLPPLEYNEASLLQDMINPSRLVEDKKLKKAFQSEIGLGTQATRAQIIETLLMRKYVKRAGKFLIAEIRGIALIDNLNSLKLSKILTLPEETALWELELDNISKGTGDPRKFMIDIRKFVSDCALEWQNNSKLISIVSDSKNTSSSNSSKSSSAVSNNLSSKTKISLGVCPLCKSFVRETDKSFSCEKWKDGCKFSIWKKIAGKKISLTQVKKILKNGKSDELKGFKSKAGKTFNASLSLSNDGVEFLFK